MSIPIQSNNDLLNYILNQADSGNKNWFGYPQQRITAINIAYEIAKYHANTMSPNEVVDYAIELNNKIYFKIIKGDNQ
jgi:hypothetical protein